MPSFHLPLRVSKQLMKQEGLTSCPAFEHLLEPPSGTQSREASLHIQQFSREVPSCLDPPSATLRGKDMPRAWLLHAILSLPVAHKVGRTHLTPSNSPLKENSQARGIWPSKGEGLALCLAVLPCRETAQQEVSESGGLGWLQDGGGGWRALGASSNPAHIPKRPLDCLGHL